jgi:hypothetical protein
MSLRCCIKSPGGFRQSVYDGIQSPHEFRQTVYDSVKSPDEFRQTVYDGIKSPREFRQTVYNGIKSPRGFRQTLYCRIQSPGSVHPIFELILLKKHEKPSSLKIVSHCYLNINDYRYKRLERTIVVYTAEYHRFIKNNTKEAMCYISISFS